jgi:2,4-diketo-3-deoxy-L-fuconate hydrolase
LIRSIPELIEMCSAFYSLLPGDVIMTGPPAGVGPVTSGDVIEVSSPELGVLRVSIA